MAVAEQLDDRITPVAVPVPGVRTWALRLDARRGDARTACLDTADLERLTGARSDDGARLLARRSLTRALVARLGNCRPQDLRFSSGEGPRTVLVPGKGSWFCSLSSTGSWALLSLASVPVGVDVERLPGPPDALQVSEHLLPAAERSWIRSGGSEMARRFLATWVRKEAVVKCTGEGLSRDLRSFVVDASARSADVHGADGIPLGIRTVALDVTGHEAALAFADTAVPPASLAT